MDIPHILHPFTSQWTLGLSSFLGYCEQDCNPPGSAAVSSSSQFQFFGNPRRGIARSQSSHTFEEAAEVGRGSQSMVGTRGLGYGTSSSLLRMWPFWALLSAAAKGGGSKATWPTVAGAVDRWDGCDGTQHNTLCSLLRLARAWIKHLTFMVSFNFHIHLMRGYHCDPHYIGETMKSQRS